MSSRNKSNIRLYVFQPYTKKAWSKSFGINSIGNESFGCSEVKGSLVKGSNGITTKSPTSTLSIFNVQCLSLVSWGHNVPVRRDRDFSFLVCCLMWFLCWSFPTWNAWHSVHVKWPVSCALAWWAMRSTSFAKTFARSVQRRSIPLKSFEYKHWNGSQRHSRVSFCPHKSHDLISRINRISLCLFVCQNLKENY